MNTDNHRSPRVLVVDDDPDTQSNLRDILELDDYEVATAGSAAEALAVTDWEGTGAIILDRLLPDGTAEELLPRLKELAPRADVLIVTGHSDLQGAIAALRQGAADYILKPINPDALRASLARVAARQRLEAAKERSEAAFRTLVEAAPCLIIILRPDGTIAYFNEYAEQLTGYSAGEVRGKDYFSLFLCEECRAEVAEQVRCVLAGVPSRGQESPIRCRDEALRRWVVWNAQLLPDYEGGPAVLQVGQDISALKAAQEQALQSARLAAIGQMMTGLAHESGNALARSQACLEMLALEVQDRPEALDMIQRIQKAQDHLRQLYEEVRGYAAPLRLEREVWDVSAVWRQAWANLSVQRQGRDAELREQTAGVDLHCPVDHFRLEQVFRNMFENSLAACRGPLRITVAGAGAELAGRPALRIAVRDNGPGLSAEQRQRIFDPFFTTKTKGTGLGMAIAKRIVDAHGGQIAVGNAAGPGAEILITLPREVP
jgi:PAS domain S-box-containing protein